MVRFIPIIRTDLLRHRLMQKEIPLHTPITHMVLLQRKQTLTERSTLQSMTDSSVRRQHIFRHPLAAQGRFLQKQAMSMSAITMRSIMLWTAIRIIGTMVWNPQRRLILPLISRFSLKHWMISEIMSYTKKRTAKPSVPADTMPMDSLLVRQMLLAMLQSMNMVS